jgi:uncharacterized protein
MNLLYLVIALVIMFLGLAGTVLPMLPGIVLIYAAYAAYGLLTSWKAFGAGTMILWGIVTCLSLFADHYGAMYGARRSGSSILGIWGSFVGAILGFILFNLIGLIVGTFAGAALGELVAGRPAGQAMKSGKAALLGFLAGSLAKVIVGLIMVGAFIWQVAKNG